MSPLRHLFRLSGALLLFVTVVGLGISPVRGQLVWTGTTSTDWNTATNWSTAAVPTSSKTVSIDLGSGNQPIIALAAAVSGNITIGNDSSSNASTSLAIESGQALTTTGNGTLGNLTSSTGGVTVTGTSSLWSLSGNLMVGNTGTGNLMISDGGNIMSGTSYIGNKSAGIGTVLVTDTNSRWNTGSAEILVGNTGSGNLTIANGGNVTSGTSYLGNKSGSTGVVLVDGVTSAWNLGNNNLFVGFSGNGTLTISNAGTVNSGGAEIAAATGSNSTVLITGTDSAWNLSHNGFTFGLSVGFSGNGSLTVSNGGSLVSGDDSEIGGQHGSNSSVLVTGASSAWNTSGELDVGDLGNGTLNITSGGYVSDIGGYIYLGSENSGSGSSNGVVLVDGANSTLNVTNSGFYIGNNANGTLTISNGGSVYGSTYTSIGDQSGSYGVVTVTGANSTWNMGGTSLYVGNQGNGNLTISNGGLVTAGSLDIALSTGSSGLVNLQSGGTLQVGGPNGISAGTTNYTFSFGGGNLQVASSDLTTSISATLMNATTSTINTNGLNATWSGILSGSGNLTKISTGTLTLSNTNLYTGSTNINGGTLAISTDVNLGTAPSSFTSSDLTFNGGTLSSSVSFALSSNRGITLNSNGGTFDVNGTATTLAYGGIIATGTGSGNLNKVDTGSLNLTGMNTYTGATEVDGGTLVVSGSGAEIANTASVTVGVTTIGNLKISNGGDVTSAGIGNIGANSGTTGTVLVDGVGSVWNMGTKALDVGFSGNASLTISNGADVTSGASQIAHSAGESGAALITGANSVWTMGSKSLDVGVSGNGNLTVSAGGNVTSKGGGNVGGNALGNGAVLIDDANSSWTIGSSDLNVGLSGNGNLTISNGGDMISGGGNLGMNSGGNGLVLVDGANSTWSLGLPSGNPTVLNVGDSGNGSLTISNGAVVANTGQNNGTVSSTLGVKSGSTGTVLVTGTNSTWSLQGGDDDYLLVGDNGTGSLTISNGGRVTSDGGAAVADGGKNGVGTAVVTGSNSIWYLGPYSMGVGDDGTGSLTISNGGSVITAAGNGGATGGSIGYFPGGNGTVLVTGANSTWNLGLSTDSPALLYVGGSGNGSLTIANGGNVISGGSSIGFNTTLGVSTFNNDDTALVTGANSTWYASSLQVGATVNGSLTIADGGSVISNGVGNGTSGIGFTSGINGTALVTAPNSVWNMGSNELDVGYQGNGTLTIANGGSVISDLAYVAYDSGSNGSVLVTGANSTWSGQSSNSLVLHLGYFGGNSNLTIANGGMVALGSLALVYQGGSSAVVNVESGGVLQVGGTNAISAGLGTYAFNFGGGTLQVSNSDLTTSINATLVNATTSTINTNGFNATWSGILSGSGNLTKIGAGTLTINATNTFTGNTTITAGTLAGNGTLGLGSATINGTLLPGSIGTAGLLSFGSNLTLTANASTDFQLGGITRGTQYSAITAGGNLSLGGLLAVDLINSFMPTFGSTFDLFQAVNIAGAFASVILPTLNTNLSWDTSQLSTNGDLDVQAINFTQWLSEAGLSGTAALPAAKPFTGGPANLIRYAMNLGADVAPANVPQPTLTTINGTTYEIIQYHVRKNMTDYALMPQYSTDLVNWTNVDSGNITQLADADTYTALYQAAVALPPTGEVFLRVVAQ